MPAFDIDFRVGAPWMAVQQALYTAAEQYDPVLLVRQRANGQLRVREQRRWQPSVRVDAEIYAEGERQTYVRLTDATHARGRIVPGTGRRARQLIGMLTRQIEELAKEFDDPAVVRTASPIRRLHEDRQSASAAVSVGGDVLTLNLQRVR